MAMKVKNYKRIEYVRAIRVNSKNREAIRAMADFDGDGAVDDADNGDWLVEEPNGCSAYADWHFKNNFIEVKK